jgi:hypothetical protein
MTHYRVQEWPDMSGDGEDGGPGEARTPSGTGAAGGNGGPER